jgi:hypothetical protein
LRELSPTEFASIREIRVSPLSVVKEKALQLFAFSALKAFPFGCGSAALRLGVKIPERLPRRLSCWMVPPPAHAAFSSG